MKLEFMLLFKLSKYLEKIFLSRVYMRVRLDLPPKCWASLSESNWLCFIGQPWLEVGLIKNRKIEEKFIKKNPSRNDVIEHGAGLSE